MYRRIVTFILVCPFVLGSFTHAIALSCAPPDPKSAFHQNDFIFTGKVLRVEKVDEVAFMGDDGETNSFAKAVIQVQTVYKGELFQTVEVYANNYWGPPFTENEEFIIYANQEKGKIISPLCSGTMHLRYAWEQLKILDSLTTGKKIRLQ